MDSDKADTNYLALGTWKNLQLPLPPPGTSDIRGRIYNHCRQRAPIENVWSTSGIFERGIFKADTDNYRKYL